MQEKEMRETGLPAAVSPSFSSGAFCMDCCNHHSHFGPENGTEGFLHPPPLGVPEADDPV